MKKYSILIVLILINYIGVQAQLFPSDMLRFSQQYPWGTARAMGMAGAFGSLGGDLSSLSINPAGLGVYRSTEFAITPSFNFNRASSTFGDKTSDFSSYLNMSNIGYVSSYNINRNGWVDLNFGIAFNKLNDFDRNVTIQRSHAPSSLLDEFTYYGNLALADSSYNPYYEGLALQTGAIYKYNDSIFSDYSDPTSKLQHGEFQQELLQSRGGIGEWDLSCGANYNNKLYIGVTLGIQQVNYSLTEPLYEQTPSDVPNLSDFTFTQYLKTDGIGLNLKIGAIYRPINMLRFGIAVHTPTVYSLHTEFYTSMDVNYRDNSYSSLSSAYTQSFNNSLATPWRAILSGSMLFKQYGLISVDYEYVNYSTMQLSGDFITDQNSSVNNNYKAVNNVRIGAEGRLGDMFLRAGYGFYGSPYKNNQLNHNTTYQTYSTGFGFRFPYYYIDFAYQMLKYPEHDVLYSYNEKYGNGLVSWNYNPSENTAKTNYNLNQFVMTMGFRF